MKLKEIYSILFFVIAYHFIPGISFLPSEASAQAGSQVKWQKDIFGQKVFVENKGQFNNWTKMTSSIKYVVNNSDKIFFTQQGLTYKLVKSEISSDEDLEEKERETKKTIDAYYVNMQWEGCNENPVLEASEETEGYYTFGEKGFENVKAKGYRKLVYKELYPGIDVEYIIPDKGGIKYSLIIHPGADISKVKMKYTGDIDKIEISSEGNILVKTPAGEITDHAPLSFYKETSEKINSDFELKGNTVSFALNLKSQITNLKSIIIDPWTTTPTSLTTNNAAFDVDYDYYGNVYVSGGSYPYKLAKYSSGGSLLWTFTVPAGWGPMYTRFCLLRQSGTAFIGEASTNPGTRVIKISSGGTLQLTSASFTGTNEIWKMVYNGCTKQLIGFGGGIFGPKNIQLIADTNLTSSTAQNFNGYGTPTDCCNDIASVVMDNNGDFFAMTTSYTGLVSVDDRIQKSLNSSGYNPPCAFDVISSYDYEECRNFGIPGFAGLCSSGTVRANALDVNTSYLYSYDGKTLIAWNKTTGVVLGSVTVNFGYAAGKNRTHEGIAVDECNNVYVGGTNQVHVYSFNGTTFTAGTPLTSNIPSEVYDVCLGQMNKLYVCGDGFVTELQITSTLCNQMNLTTSSINSSCSTPTGSATVTATGGNPPYTYLWNPTGQTTQTATGLPPGTYTVTVFDNSCKPKIQIDTVVISSIGGFTVANTQSNISCNGGSNGSSTATVTGGTSPFTYSWSPSGGTNATATGLSQGTYTATVTDAAGCVQQLTVTITQPTLLTSSVTAISTTCGSNTGSATVTASGGTGGYSYNWNPSGQTTTTATGLSAGNYSVTVSDANGCITINTISVTSTGSITATAGPNSTICSGQTATLTSSGGTNYSWNNGNTNSTINVSPTTNTTYTVIVSNGSCADTAYATVTVNSSPVISVSGNTVLCVGDVSTLTATGGINYSWSNGSTSAVINVSPTSTSTYTVISSNANGCTAPATITVVVSPPPVAVANNATICEGQSAILTASGGSNYSWSTGATTSSITAAATATATYTVIVSTGSCTDTTTATVVVNPNPTATAWSNVTITQGQSATLSASGGGTYVWSNGATGSNISVSPLATTLYCVTVSNGNCNDTACVMVYVEPIDCGYADEQLFVPDAFSPNGDTKNDVLGVYYPNISCIKEFNLIIYDRLGEKVFEANKIADTWDGTYNGKAMNSAVFIYYMKVTFINDKEIIKKGNVSLIQ